MFETPVKQKLWIGCIYFSGFTGMCVDHVPSPAANAKNKVQHVYTGPMDTELAESMSQCDPDVCWIVGF